MRWGKGVGGAIVNPIRSRNKASNRRHEHHTTFAARCPFHLPLSCQTYFGAVAGSLQVAFTLRILINAGFDGPW